MWIWKKETEQNQTQYSHFLMFALKNPSFFFFFLLFLKLELVQEIQPLTSCTDWGAAGEGLP
jgi:hypothetical protein